MTRKSEREIENDLEELGGGSDPTRPLTGDEIAAVDDDVDVEAWGASPNRRAMFRALILAARETDR